VRPDPRCPPLRGDDIQIGLTVNRIGSHEVDKYVFVFGGARQSRARPTQAMLRGFVKTFLELDPDIVTGYNIMDSTSNTSTAALRSCPMLAADLELGRIRP
jgi:DNA polymerase elongation subunit (family B)